MATIEHVTPDGGTWCTVEKSSHLAALVFALRPTTIVEIGVFFGGSLVPLALAQQRYADPASSGLLPSTPGRGPALAGETAPQTWPGGRRLSTTGSRQVHEAAGRHGLTELVEVVGEVRRGDAAAPIGLLHIDGYHGEQAARTSSVSRPHSGRRSADAG